MRAITLALGLLIIVIQATANGQISGASVELLHQSIALRFAGSQAEALRQFRARCHLSAQ